MKKFSIAVEVMMSLLVIGGLFWVAFFVKPTVQVKKIERFPFERRDAFYSVTALDEEGRSICAVGSYGKVVRSDDGGSTWAIQEVPTRTHLQKVLAWDNRTLLAIGDRSTVLVTRDGGRNWKTVEVPSFPMGDQLLSGYIDSASGRAWVVGGMGTVLVSDDRGETWSMTHPEEDVSWNDVTVAEGQAVWVVGEFGSVKRSTDGGRTWEAVSVPTESSLNAIAFSDATHGVIVGLSGTVLATADGGRSWQLAASGAQSHLYDLLWDGRTYRAVGDAGMILTADAQAVAWQVDKLAPQNFAWYTGIARAGGSYFISGAGVGVYADGKWKPFAPGRKSYKKGGIENG